MTRDDVLRLARQAWNETGEGWTADAWFDSRAASFKRFADLVAAEELSRAREIVVAGAFAAAVAEERDACATLCEQCDDVDSAARFIRARGSKP